MAGLLVALVVAVGSNNCLAAKPVANKVELAPDKRPVLIAWTAKWCRFCHKAEPMVWEYGKSGKFNVVFVDFDDYRKLAKTQGVTKLPTFLVVEDGKITYRTRRVQQLQYYKTPSKKDKK